MKRDIIKVVIRVTNNIGYTGEERYSRIKSNAKSGDKYRKWDRG